MATRNRTTLFRKHRDAIKAVRTPDSSLIGSGNGDRSGGPVIEMTSLLNSNASSSSYTPLSTDDPSTSRQRRFLTRSEVDGEPKRGIEEEGM